MYTLVANERGRTQWRVRTDRGQATVFGKKTKVHYEIDHVHPINAGGVDDLMNFQFLSANANQFVKCSLTYDDLLKRIDLSDILKDRIRDVLRRREKLFASKKWADFMNKINKIDNV